jgi:serine/threonine protein kinase
MWRESTALEQVRHPNVIRLLAAGVTQDTHRIPYVLMPLLSGASLRVLLDGHRALGLQRALDLGIALFEALDAVHREQIAHCDVRPENIFVERRAPLVHELVLLDFGLAYVASARQPAPHPGMGDARYAAPELCFGTTPSVASDLYAAGLVLFELFTGVHALSPSRGDWRYTQCFVAPPSLVTLLSAAPKDLTALLESLLAKHISDRPRSAAACAAGLRDVQGKTRQGSSVNMASTTTEDAFDSLLRTVAGPFSNEVTQDDQPTVSLLHEASPHDTYPSPPPSSGSIATGA